MVNFSGGVILCVYDFEGNLIFNLFLFFVFWAEFGVFGFGDFIVFWDYVVEWWMILEF